MLKHSFDREEWKGLGVVILDEEMERGFHVTMGKHGLHNVTGGELPGPGAVGFGNPGEQFRGDRRRNRPRFRQEAVASGGREFLDGVEPFEQGSPRPSEVAGGFGAGDPQQRGRADGGVSILRLPPGNIQKAVSHGESVTLWPACGCAVLNERSIVGPPGTNSIRTHQAALAPPNSRLASLGMLRGTGRPRFNEWPFLGPLLSQRVRSRERDLRESWRSETPLRH